MKNESMKKAKSIKQLEAEKNNLLHPSLCYAVVLMPHNG